MDISFQIDRGEIIATIGANSAGKSTALKAVSRLLGAFSGQITEGEVFLEGKEQTKEPASSPAANSKC